MEKEMEKMQAEREEEVAETRDILRRLKFFVFKKRMARAAGLLEDDENQDGCSDLRAHLEFSVVHSSHYISCQLCR